MDDPLHDLKLLIASFHGLLIVETVEEERLEVLLGQACEDLGLHLFDWSITTGLRRFPERIELGANTMRPGVALGHLADLTVDAVFWLRDFGRFLDDASVVRRLREAATRFSGTRGCLLLSGRSIVLPPEVDPLASNYELRLPDPRSLLETVQATLASLRERHDFEVDLEPGAERELAGALAGLTLAEARQAVARAVLEDGRLDAADVAGIVRHKAHRIGEGGLVDYLAPVGNDVELGGFGRLKGWLERASVGFTEAAAAMNLPPPKGLLLTGVQGCGKSLAAREVARAWGVPLLRLDAGRLFDKFIGETERNFREAVRIAESVAPCVLWIDEIEKAFAGGGAGGESHDGGTSRRLLGAFLTWLQEKKASVFVVGTANQIESLPPELMRKGRFDEIFFVDLPDAGERAEIFSIHLRRRNCDPAAFDVPALVRASDGFSGAEIEQAVLAAAYRALHERRPLGTDLVLGELGGTRPLSVSRAEAIDSLRAFAAERFVPVR